MEGEQRPNGRVTGAFGRRLSDSRTHGTGRPAVPAPEGEPMASPFHPSPIHPSPFHAGPTHPGSPAPASTSPGAGTYANWVGWLEAFRRGDDVPVDDLDPVDGRLGPYVEARLLDRLSAAVTERIRRWRAELADDVIAAPPSDGSAAAVLLAEASRRLGPLERLASSPLLPAEVTTAIGAALVELRAGARGALEDARRRMVEETVELPVVDRPVGTVHGLRPGIPSRPLPAPRVGVAGRSRRG